MKLLYEVAAVTCLDDESVTLRETTAVDHGAADDPLSQALRSHYTTVIRTRDEAVRRALIQLGWRPPIAGGGLDGLDF